MDDAELPANKYAPTGNDLDISKRIALDSIVGTQIEISTVYIRSPFEVALANLEKIKRENPEMEPHTVFELEAQISYARKNVENCPLVGAGIFNIFETMVFNADAKYTGPRELRTSDETEALANHNSIKTELMEIYG